MKFHKGMRVALNKNFLFQELFKGDEGVINGFYGDIYKVKFDKGIIQEVHETHLEPITNSKTKPMGRKKYVLLKESPELRKGAIVEEMCDDGTQGFISITKEHHKNDSTTTFSRKIVMEQPKWFREVTPLYVFADKLRQIQKLIKKIQ